MMTVMEFRTGGPQREPRGPGVLAGLRERLGRRCPGPAVVPTPRSAPDADERTRGRPTG